MRVSICLDTGRPWAEVLCLAELADLQGWSTLYVPDHFMPYAPPGAAAPPGRMLESWSALAMLGAVTSRIRLGTLVLGNTYRHPAVVANMAATLDTLTGGRLVLGLGAGWQENEHVAYGIDLPPVRERLDRLAEACAVISSMLRHERTTFSGTHYRLTDAPNVPAAVSSPLPLLIGGAGELRTMRIAATYADMWHAWTTSPSSFQSKSAVMDDHCAALGRDPATIERLTGQHVRLTGDHPGRSTDDLTGTAAQIADALSRYRDVGLSEFVLRDHGDEPLSAMTDVMETINAVLPDLR